MGKTGKITVSTIILLTMFAAAFGNYSSLIGKVPVGEVLLYTLLNFAISVGCLMLVPFFTWVDRGKRLPYKSGKKLCKWNSIILVIISCILVACGICALCGGLGAFALYFVNKWLFVADEPTEEELEKEEASKQTVNCESAENSTQGDDKKDNQ